MAEHSELVAEMAHMDRYSTQERLKQAKRRRLQQMKKWKDREKEYNSNKKKKDQNMAKNKVRKSTYKVHFVPSVMLLEAASRNDIEEVRRLLMLGVSPDSTNEDGLTALHQCCIDDSEEMLKLLLEFGANVNAKDSEQWTPLHAAATCGHIHIVKYLISKGADLLAVNADGNMPYDICDEDLTLDYIENEMARRGVTQAIIDRTRAATENLMLRDLKMLHAQNKDFELKDEMGATSLHIASANGYLTVIEFLLEHNLQVNTVDNDSWQPIHAAACWGHPDAIDLLVQAGASINARTKNGETPYDISEDPEVRERIIQLKQEMETKKGSQSNRLRRTHSQNTRSQSIRRTSIREKAQISRREAREEAKLRQDTTGQTQLYDSEDETKHLNANTQNELSAEVDPQDINISFLSLDGKDTLQKFRAKTACELLDNVENKKMNIPLKSENGDVPNSVKNDSNSCQARGDEVSNKGSKAAVPTLHSSNLVQTEKTSVIQQTPGQSVNVEIHVTVNTSPTYSPSQGTLPELKKTRSGEIQRSSNSSTSSQVDVNGKTPSQNGHFVNGVYLCDSPPSPNSTRAKFRADPLEVVGGKKKKSCCHVM